MAAAKANPDAAWPDGNDVEAGIRTLRQTGTPAPARSGRCRAQMDLTARFTSADVAPMASVPRSAARRPAPPPARASAAAIANQRPEVLAALEGPRSGPACGGGGAAAAAAETPPPAAAPPRRSS